MPNVYLYAANNPSEATLAKRRIGADHRQPTSRPPVTKAGLYKGLLELKASLDRWRGQRPGRARDAPTSPR